MTLAIVFNTKPPNFTIPSADFASIVPISARDGRNGTILLRINPAAKKVRKLVIDLKIFPPPGIIPFMIPKGDLDGLLSSCCSSLNLLLSSAFCFLLSKNSLNARDDLSLNIPNINFNFSMVSFIFPSLEDPSPSGVKDLIRVGLTIVLLIMAVLGLDIFSFFFSSTFIPIIFLTEDLLSSIFFFFFGFLDFTIFLARNKPVESIPIMSPIIRYLILKP